MRIVWDGGRIARSGSWKINMQNGLRNRLRKNSYFFDLEMIDGAGWSGTRFVLGAISA